MLPVLTAISGSGIAGLHAEQPWLVVLEISVLVGLLMVVVFRYTSDQKQIGRAKNTLKAHLLAVRLFQDQLPVVMRAYGRILLGTGNYLRLAFKPFLIAIVPVVLLMIQLDRCLGWTPIEPHQSFLLTVQPDTVERLSDIQLKLAPELISTAPAVHIEKDNQIVWRLEATSAGKYEIGVVIAGAQTMFKQVVVSGGIRWISPVRMQGSVWQRMLSSGEPSLTRDSHIRSISINYPPRHIAFLGWQWDWILLFFVMSMAAGFIFKTVFRIQI